MSHVGKCAWCGTIDAFLSEFDRGSFVERMKTTNADVSDHVVGRVVGW